MTQTNDTIMAVLSSVALPNGGNLASRDMIRALTINGGRVSFVIEAESPEQAAGMEAQRHAAEAAIAALDGVESVSVILTAHGPAAGTQAKAPASNGGEPPKLTIGQHPTKQDGPQVIPGVDRVIAIASGKGGVGKSTLSSNLAVALAKAGRRVGLLDADIFGPSQPRMMGTMQQPGSRDGKTMDAVDVHGVKLISIGLLTDPGQAVVWRGPMLTGALQQLLFKVNWGKLDVLILDLPPGTGDVQLSLSQNVDLTGALIVSTPQDVALLDAVKAIDMFNKVDVPILGLVENMSMYVCPQCGHEDHIFGQGGVRTEAEKRGLPFLGEIPLSVDVRLAGDEGKPIALGDGPMAEAYNLLAAEMVKAGIA
ncbi:MAG: Mrp/NBP35 family ATP-binding protein [Rhodobacteraceae bacterium]|nr:Mrp/NBP35 family ATP-binding protein [Paracoccaceae bacterium]